MDNGTNAGPVNLAKKILVVEDEQYLRDLYVELLKEDGYEVASAIDGEIAYDLITKNSYDLVLLDLVMPRMPGIALLKKLSDQDHLRKQKLKIVVLTNLGQDTVIAEAISFGVRGYIIKSDVTPDKILSEVKYYLAQP
ncbi:MAG: Fis family transcriptional regulator [Candidatus Gottesmanbacteria bacterium GW2011_GWA2_43_14]|uniref:Fis family transcriptional regulator n=1 Tax=Candidatus Gottesmanbacteria bacterium GW2011_GWA2_43_14 TaxID=1618443 RepID=A0A0G1GA99_9BACT|nr:MAG: Fis family transcriptional regulator [Candidatus Gottesmanbacteria bacterium GW2011_GWA2_43_14]